MEKTLHTLPILTITGSDSTGGAGVQADIKTITTLGGYAVSAITSVTVQNTLGIQDFFDLPPTIVAGQIEAIADDVQPVAVKVGMLRSVEVVDAIADALKRINPPFVVYDPNIVSSRGEQLMSPEVVEKIKSHFLKLCTLVVISKRAASAFWGRPICNMDDMVASASGFLNFGCQSILLQGDLSEEETVTDVLLIGKGCAPILMTSPAATEHIHGIGSTLSAAIATKLGQGLGLYEAVEQAKSFIHQQIALSGNLEGRGSELFNQLVSLINTHYKTSNDVRFYAEQLNVSSRYLAQVTKRLAAKTPKTLIDDCIIKQAEALLEGSDKTVQEITYELGFRSQAHFTTFFKKQKGQTPSEYRKKI